MHVESEVRTNQHRNASSWLAENHESKPFSPVTEIENNRPLDSPLEGRANVLISPCSCVFIQEMSGGLSGRAHVAASWQ